MSIMKLRYFIPIVVALVAMFTGCSEDNDPIYLDNIKVSTSYVSLDTDGKTPAEMTLNATTDWSVDEKTVPEWLTISPMSGAAGETKVQFSASAATGRKAVVKINCGGQTQEINIIQGIATVETATCAEVLAGADAKTYRVTGTVTAIANTIYGNWYLNDGTGEVYIYGTLDKSGKDGQNNSIAAWGIEVGDEVTVEGPKTTYNGTVELVNVTVVKINKSLIKVDSLTVGGVKSNGELPLEGGNITAAVTCKGDGINVEIPADAKDWLFISSITSKSVTFYALPNAGGDRSTTITFKTFSNKKEYTSQTTISQKGAIIECSIADFLAAPVGDTQYRITGVITKVAKAEYGNIYVKDYSGETYVYGVGAKGDFEKLGLKVGDIVTLVGKRSAYKEDPQMGGGQYEKHISVTEISLADFLTKPDDKNVYYMVTGTVKDLLSSAGKENDYGNLHLTDGTNELYVYGCYPGYGAPKGDAQKGFIKAAGIKVGDKLTMIGYKDTYNGLIELCGGTYFSHESAE
jgi:RPA family protein